MKDVSLQERMKDISLQDKLRKALKSLLAAHREALILVDASGFSYEDAAKICGCTVDTIKSRVSSARDQVCNILSSEA